MEPTLHRARTLLVRYGNVHLILPGHDVTQLIEAIDTLAEGVRKAHLGRDVPGATKALEGHLDALQRLKDALAAPAHSLADPPLEITREHGRLLRQVLADISGYQRGELTSSLRELRRILSEA
jgi:hypothetical protein